MRCKYCKSPRLIKLSIIGSKQRYKCQTCQKIQIRRERLIEYNDNRFHLNAF